MLEATQHASKSFVTLTYTDQALAFGANGLATLEPKHLQDWLKRLRKKLVPLKLRYYAVGEYGDESWRPHYHVVLFGYGPCERGRTRKDYHSEGRVCCSVCDTVLHTWGLGGVDVGTLENGSARYVAGYIEKKLTRSDDSRLLGRFPEFNRMSRHNGGIGSGAMHDLASDFMLFNLEKREADVPSALRLGKSVYAPLGKYLRKRLRVLIGRDEKIPDEVLAEYEAEVRVLYADIWNSSKAERNGLTVKEAFRQALIEKESGSVASLLARSQIHKQRKSL